LNNIHFAPKYDLIYGVITIDVSNYINLLVRIAHIICNHPLHIWNVPFYDTLHTIHKFQVSLWSFDTISFAFQMSHLFNMFVKQVQDYCSSLSMPG